MNVVFYFYSSFGGAMYGLLLDEAKKYAEDPSNDVYFLFCKGLYKVCLDNPTGNEAVCAVCSKHTDEVLKPWLQDNLVQLEITDYFKGPEAEYPSEYTTALEFRNLKYREVSVGYSALSSYVHQTRNHDPLINDFSKKYFSTQLEQACRLTDAMHNLVDDLKPGLICTYNGRFNEVRPVFEVAIAHQIDFKLYEFVPEGDGSYNKVVFDNAMPHDVKKNLHRIETCWNDPCLAPGENRKLGEAFFTKRRSGVRAGDKVYIGNQKQGMLPDGWDDSKNNIAIFNSSEDEFVAVGGEYVNLSLYPSQIDGLHDIFENFKDDSSIHFYLRIHPNLGEVTFSYHKDLYDFLEKYSNLTLIEPKSPISTYDLMEAANKVVVFGSTMGLESVYWKKPVILLCCGLYYYSDITYNPSTKGELYQLLQAHLDHKYSDEVLKYGLYLYYKEALYINEGDQKYKYVNFNPIKFKVFGRVLNAFPFDKLLGSSKLSALRLYGLRYLASKFGKNRLTLPNQDASGKT